MKTVMGAAAVALTLSASPAFALPSEWNAFLQCTREFGTPRPHAPGHYETVVSALRVIEKCYVVVPPAGLPPPSGEFGPNRPSADPRTLEDVPCEKIDDTKRALQERLTDLGYELRTLETSIDNAEVALRVATEVSDILSADSRQASQACDRAQSTYQAELTRKAAEMTSQCRQRRPPEARLDCLDEKLAAAQNLLANSNEAILAQRLCDIAKSINEFYQRQDQVRARLTQELSRSRDDRIDLLRERMRIEATLRRLNARQSTGDCKP